MFFPRFNSVVTTALALPLCAGLLAHSALSQEAPAPWKMAPGSLSMQWAKQVSPANALPEYPRPQLTRARWQSLNGLWNYGLTDAVAPAAMNAQILVPF